MGIYGSTRRKTSFAIVCLATLIAGFLSVPTPAQSGDGVIRYVTRSQKIAAGATKTDKAPCPSGTKVVGGGVDIEGGHGATTVNTTAPYDGGDADKKPDDGWMGTINNGAPPLPEGRRVMTTFAVCASGRYRYVTDRTDLLTAENVTRSAFCPDGTIATGGGVSVSVKSLTAYVSQSAPVDDGDPDSIRSDGWTAAVSLSGPKDGSMRTTAICTDPIGYVWEYNEVPVTLTSLGFAVEATAVCDPGASVTGGGVVHTGPYSVTLHTTVPIDTPADPDTKLDNGWTAKLSNPSSSYLMTGIAICRLPV